MTFVIKVLSILGALGSFYLGSVFTVAGMLLFLLGIDPVVVVVLLLIGLALMLVAMVVAYQAGRARERTWQKITRLPAWKPSPTRLLR